MVEFTLGPTHANIFIVFIAIGAYGGPISYLLFFYEFFESALYSNTDPELSHKLVYAIFALGIIIPITLFNNFAILAHFSGVANVTGGRGMGRAVIKWQV